jgi:hypothetical protein
MSAPMSTSLSHRGSNGVPGSRRSLRFFSLTLAAMVVFLAVWVGSASAAGFAFAKPSKLETEGGPKAEAIQDVNGDGIPDLVIANWRENTVSVSIGRGDGTFRAPVGYNVARPTGVAVADLNGDGIPDLAVSSESESLEILIGVGEGHFKPRATYQTGGLYAQGLAVGDFENDGRVDVAVINSGSANVTIMSNNGTGEFNLTSTISINGNPTSIAAADFNGDGILDLAIVDDQNGLVDVAYGDVSGGFLAPVGSPVGQYAEKIAVGDFNGDGNPDVAVSDYGADDVAVLLNLGGNESFAAPTFYAVGHLPTGIAVGDLNGDGNADIAVTNQGDRVLSVLEGDGDGAFGAQVAVPTPVSPSNVAIGDLTGSGENDMVVLNESGNAAYTYLAGTASTLTVQTGSPSYTVEEEVSATATLAGAGSPSGTLTFSLFGPGDEACERYPVYTKEVAAAGPGTYEATSYGIYEGGAYHWVVEYSGNATNSPVANSCADPEAELVVLKGAPIITSEASGSVGLGDHISDVATLSGGSAYPQGTITFNVYGPDDATCSSAPAFTYEEEAYGDGAYYSSEFTPAEPGTYRFVAEYSGDRSNEPDANGCTDPQASVLVTNAAPSIFTESSGNIDLGESTSDTAYLIDGSSPTGTITFRLYGPGAMNCGERLVFTSAPVTVSGEGEYSSESFTPTESGYYFWVAEYSGDPLNEPVSELCGEAEETFWVAKAPTTIELTAGPNPAASGGTVTLTAKVEGADPTGTVVFIDGRAPIGEATVESDGTATLRIATLGKGAHALSAKYMGDVDNGGSASAPIGLVIEPIAEGGGGETVKPVRPDPVSPSTPPKVSAYYWVKAPPATDPASGYRYTFRFNDGLSGSTFYCRLGSAPWKPCPTPKVVRHVKTGAHSFSVKSVTKTGVKSKTKVLRFITAGLRQAVDM